MNPNIYFLYTTSKYNFLHPQPMKKQLLSGLAALVMGCASTNTDIPSPSTPKVEAYRKFNYKGIIIQGPGGYDNRVIQALDLIHDHDPQNWLAVEKNITVIRYNPPSGIQVTTGVFDTDINKTTAHYFQPIPWVAGEIVHDAWHREYYRRGEIYSGWEGEKKCIERQNEFFAKVGYPLQDVEQVLNTRFWEIQPRTW
jgi:hypothetical protein